MRSILKLLMLVSLALLGASLWLREALPPPDALDESLLQEPLQTPIVKPPFQTDVGGITYTVKPLYRYELTGLVVSGHDAGSWRDILHRDWQDKLNVADLCVVWGVNAKRGSYRGIEFWNGQFTCNWQTSSSELFAAFDQTAISNNHLLTDSPALARAIRSARVGDQIELRGMLSEYSHNHGFAFHRGTSITRTDSGNGACETIYVDDFRIIRSGGGIWRSMSWIAAVMMILSVIAWLSQPPRFDD